MSTTDPPALTPEILKPYIESLRQSQTFKKTLCRKMVKKCQNDFKRATDTFLEDT